MEEVSMVPARREARWSSAAAIEDAPPPFAFGGKTAMPVKFSQLAVALTIDAAQGLAESRALISFRTALRGCPVLDLLPDPTGLALDGQGLDPSRLGLVQPPDHESLVRVLDVELEAGTPHQLEVRHPLDVEFAQGGARLGFFMSDLTPRWYLERYVPANLEFDQYPISVQIELLGATSPHRLFCNGRVTDAQAHRWKASFPDYFTCSSCYLHLTNSEVEVREGNHQGIERAIPITAYGDDPGRVEAALSRADAVLGELETSYGPYAHGALLIYATEGGGGMEYCGATMTSLEALGHEILHSWFARGVMPANGNAGWIDEAIASWRDNGYPRVTPDPTRSPVNLAGFSPYRRETPEEAYTAGALLVSELDGLVGGAGLRPVLGRLFLERRHQLITTPFFQTFLEEQTGKALGAMFGRFVYGRQDERDATPRGLLETEAARIPMTERLKRAWRVRELVPPPRSYTLEELRRFL
jgi:hypothetical protein